MMANVKTIVIVYAEDHGLKVTAEGCGANHAEMLLAAALAQVQRELLATRLGAPSPSGIIAVNPRGPVI